MSSGYHQLERGFSAGPLKEWESLRHSTMPADRAHVLALESMMWFAGLEPGRLPELHEVERLIGVRSAHVGVSRVCSTAVLAAAIAFDRVAAESWLRIFRELTLQGETHTRVLAEAWAIVMDGGHPDVATQMAEAAASARQHEDAASVIAASVITAMNALALGDLLAATQAARRASRMAAAESRPQSEYLAHLVLARVRRACGAPHLALHILRGLSKTAPSPWQAWIQFDACLAGRRDEPASGTPAHDLWTLRAAAADGDRTLFDQRAASLSARTSGFSMIAREVCGLLLALDPVAPLPPDEGPLEDWVRGKTEVVPLGMHAFGSSESGLIASVVVPPDQASRRLLYAGHGLLPGDSCVLDRGERARERTNTGVALLALAKGRKIDESEFFTTLYGFEYELRHKSVFDALIHRMRESIGEEAELVRSGGALSLTPRRMLTMHDPRCEQPLEDRIARTLAAQGPTAAREVSAALSVPLRTVQEALSALIEAGACLKARQGRSIEYRVEDTTFSEPTRAG